MENQGPLKIDEVPAVTSVKKVSSGSLDTLGSVANLSKEEIETLKNADGLVENPKELGNVALKVFANVTDPELLTTVLMTIEKYLIEDVNERAYLLFSNEENLLDGIAGDESTLEFSKLVLLVSHNDPLVSELSAYLSALLMSAATNPLPESIIISLIAELTKQIDQPPALQSLAVLLRNEQARKVFAKINGLERLMVKLESLYSLNVDAQYRLMLCVWSACFEEKAAKTIEQPGIKTLLDVLASDPHKKVLRVCVATIRIVMEHDPPGASEVIIEKKGPKLFQVIQAKKIEDQELIADLEWIMNTLHNNFKVLTTFKRHEQELLTKSLSWSMIHEELFWKENALKFESNNFRSVQLLVELLDSDDPQTVAVACSDLGNFVRYFPNGKLIIEKYGAKDRILELLTHQNQEVHKQALSACSKIMINNWESFKS